MNKMKPYQKQNLIQSVIMVMMLLVIALLATYIVNVERTKRVVDSQLKELMIKQPVIGKAFINHDIDSRKFITCIKTSKTVSPDNTVRCLSESATLRQARGH